MYRSAYYTWETIYMNKCFISLLVFLFVFPTLGATQSSDQRYGSAIRLMSAVTSCGTIKSNWDLAKSALKLGHYELFINSYLASHKQIMRLLNTEDATIFFNTLNYYDRFLVGNPDSEYSPELCAAYQYTFLVKKDQMWYLDDVTFSEVKNSSPSVFNKNETELNLTEVKEKLVCLLAEQNWGTLCKDAHWWDGPLTQ